MAVSYNGGFQNGHLLQCPFPIKALPKMALPPIGRSQSGPIQNSQNYRFSQNGETAIVGNCHFRKRAFWKRPLWETAIMGNDHFGNGHFVKQPVRERPIWETAIMGNGYFGKGPYGKRPLLETAILGNGHYGKRPLWETTIW